MYCLIHIQCDSLNAITKVMQCCNVRDVNDAALYVDAFQGGEEETVAHFDFYAWKVKEVQLSYRYTYVSGLPHQQYLCRIKKIILLPRVASESYGHWRLQKRERVKTYLPGTTTMTTTTTTTWAVAAAVAEPEEAWPDS